MHLNIAALSAASHNASSTSAPRRLGLDIDSAKAREFAMAGGNPCLRLRQQLQTPLPLRPLCSGRQDRAQRHDASIRKTYADKR